MSFQLQTIAPGIHCVTHPFKLAGMEIGSRMTCVEIGDALWLHSPVAVETYPELCEQKHVAFVVAPNLYHHASFEKCCHFFDKARAFAVDGLAEKIGLDSLTIESIPKGEWLGVFECIRIEGMPKHNETVFYHRPTKTLIAADLIFHVPRAKGLYSRFMWWFIKVKPLTPVQSRIFRSFVKDRNAYRKSVEKLRALDVDNIIMAHGEPIIGNGNAALRQATSWID